MATIRRKISELTALVSASLDTTVLGVDGGTTYKIELDTLADAVTARVNILDRNRLAALESVTSSFEIKGVNLVSSSAQIAGLGFITTSSFQSFSSSIHSEILAATNEQSFNGLISGSSQLTSSYDERYVLSGSITQMTWDNIANKPSGIVSQSTDLTSLNNFTASISTASLVDRLNAIESVSGSWITESETGSFLTSLNGTISSSSELTASFDQRYVLSGSVINSSTPAGTISSSAQITEFGFISSSQTIDTGSFATTGSNTFVGETVFNEKVTINHDLIATGSSLFGNGNFNEIAPEKFLVIQNDTTNYNIIVGKADTNNYSQILVTNLSNGISASSDIVAQADNGGETNMYADLGVNSSGYTGNGNGIGAANDAYVYGKAKNFWVGNLTTQSLYLFANPNGTADVTLENGILNISGSLVVNGGISGNIDYNDLTNVPTLLSGSSQLTSSFDQRYTLSGSVQNITLPSNLISSSAQITAFGFVSSSTGTPEGTISSSAQITAFGFVSGSYETTGRGIISSSADLVTISSFNEYTASISTGSLISRLEAIENETGSFLTSLNGTISSSAQITEFGFVSGSYETTGKNIISSSTQISSLGFAELNGGNTFNGIQIFNDPIEANSITASSLTVTTFYAVSSSVASTSGSTSFGSTNSDIMFVTGSVRVTNELSASTINGIGSVTQYSSSVSNRINLLEAGTSSYETKGRGIISGSSQLTSSYDLRYATSASYLTSLNGAISSSVQVLGGSGVISGSSQLTSSFDNRYLTIGGDGVISGSSQLTSSYDNRYTLSGSVSAVPSGTISGSSQLTSSFDQRYTLSGSVTAVPAGTISSSAQITAFGFVSSSTGTPAGTISGSSQLTASFDGRYLVTGSVTASISTLNTFTSSLNIWTSSIATTGSNSFNGNQTITGSLIVSSVAVISASLSIPSGSILSLTSGSNLVVQNNGLVEITGSLRVSGSTTITGSINISSGSITMPNRPAFRVTGAGGPTSAVTVLSGSMTSVDYNQGGWDNATGTFTAPIAGLYQVNLVCRTNSNASSAGQIIVYKNNTGGTTGTTQVMIEWAANTTMNHAGGSTISKLAVGDTLKAVVAVGTLSFDGNDNFSVAYIG